MFQFCRVEKSHKIEKDFLLSDDSVNVYGYRLLTAGYQLAMFKKNPIGYRMHNRTEGVVLRWTELRVEDGKVYGKPVINLSHAKGQQTVDEVENGFLNAASIGHIVALEVSNDKKDKLPNQTGPTITKWYNKETSLVDIPGNENALTDLFDADDNPINLADFTQSKNFNPIKNNMKDLKTRVIKHLNLADNTTDEVVNVELQNLFVKAAKIDDLIAAKSKLEDQLKDLKAVTTKKEVADLLDTGLADGKFTKEVSDALKVDYAENPEGLKKLVDSMPAYKSLTDRIATGQKELPKEMAGKTLLELQDADLLEKVKKDFPDLYDELKKQHKEGK